MPPKTPGSSAKKRKVIDNSGNPPSAKQVKETSFHSKSYLINGFCFAFDQSVLANISRPVLLAHVWYMGQD